MYPLKFKKFTPEIMQKFENCLETMGDIAISQQDSV
jgi:hypothetical protein